jgi:predicted RNA binding protein with dsRBD fold (UPF0201 family)
MQTQKKPAPVKKTGTKTTEVFIGQGLQKLNSAMKAFNDMTASFNKVAEELEQNTFKVAEKELRLAELSAQYEEKKRSGAVQLELDMKENAANKVADWLATNKKIAIDLTAYHALQEERDALKLNSQKEKEAAVMSAIKAVNAQHDATMRVREAEFKATEASTLAQLNSLKGELQSARAEATRWEAALGSERTAGVERAKAAAVGSITVGSPVR